MCLEGEIGIGHGYMGMSDFEQLWRFEPIGGCILPFVVQYDGSFYADSQRRLLGSVSMGSWGSCIVCTIPLGVC
jgi:hypothetical protein